MSTPNLPPLPDYASAVSPFDLATSLQLNGPEIPLHAGTAPDRAYQVSRVALDALLTDLRKKVDELEEDKWIFEVPRHTFR